MVEEILKDYKNADVASYFQMLDGKNKEISDLFKTSITLQLSQFLAAYDVKKPFSSSMQLESNKLSIVGLGRNYLSIEIFQAIELLCIVLANWVKTWQALIDKQLLDACRNLILVTNGLASLNKLNGNVLNDILQCLSKTFR